MQRCFPYCGSPPLLMGTRIINMFFVFPPGESISCKPPPPPSQKINRQLLYSKAFPFQLVAHLLKSISLSISGPLAYKRSPSNWLLKKQNPSQEEQTIRTRVPLTDPNEPQQWHCLGGPHLLQASSPRQKMSCQLLYWKAFPF